MTSNNENFQDRIARIQKSRRGRRNGTGFVVHPDGVVTAIGRPSSRLRFGFPIKGLFLAFSIALAVKAYLVWALGLDIYNLEVNALLEGSSIERLAGQVLRPDVVTMWMVDRYDQIYGFVQGGIAASREG